MDDVPTESWECRDCGHVEEDVPVDELAGRPIKKTVGSGRRLDVIETVVCPACYSEAWNSESVRALTGTVDAALTDE